MKRINKERQETAPGHKFIGQSFHSDKLSDPSVALAYITASPRMSLYMKYSTQIYQVYLRYFAPEDIHVYSIDEVFIDLTGYLTNYQMGAKELISKVTQDVLQLLPGLVRIYILQRLQWILWQSMCRQTSMG